MSFQAAAQNDFVISLSGIYRQMNFYRDFSSLSENLPFSPAFFVDAEDIKEKTFFCSEEAAGEIRKRIQAVPLRSVHWIDSGDYHYLSLFFLERITVPFGLFLLDHHSDMKESAFGPELLTCGSWVLKALQTLPMLKSVILVGPDGKELPEDLQNLFGPEDASPTFRRAELYGKRILSLPESLLPDEFNRISSDIPVSKAEASPAKEAVLAELKQFPFYLSFDKDILDPSEITTDWSQGTFSFGQAAGLIRFLCSKTELFGIDLCGEALNDPSGISEKILEKNEFLNRRLRAFLFSLLFSSQE